VPLAGVGLYREGVEGESEGLPWLLRNMQCKGRRTAAGPSSCRGCTMAAGKLTGTLLDYIAQ